MATTKDYLRIHVPTMAGRVTTVALEQLMVIEIGRQVSMPKLQEAASELSLKYDKLKVEPQTDKTEEAKTRNSYVVEGLKKLLMR